MTEHEHRTLRTILWFLAIVISSILLYKIVTAEPKVNTVVEHRRDSAQVIVINPTPSQTIVSKDPIYVPPNYDDLVKAFMAAVRERDEVNKYDSVVYVKHDTDTVARIPYHITTKGKLLDFRMTPAVISEVKTITKEQIFGLYGGVSTMVVGSQAYINFDGSYQGKNGNIYTLAKGLNANTWQFGVKIPIIRK